MASKLFRSYQFLEKEEPKFIDPEKLAEEPVESLPNYESVNLLRLAQRNEKFTREKARNQEAGQNRA